MIAKRKPFDLTAHLARSAEQRAWDLTAHLRQRQPIALVRSTCALMRRREAGDVR
jgi:hypothetical protein